VLKLRLLSATVIIAALVGLLYLDQTHPWGAPGVWLLPLAVLVAVLMVHELLELWRERPDRPAAWPLYIGAAVTVLLAAAPLWWSLQGQPHPAGWLIGRLGWPLLGMTAGLGLAFVAEMARYTQPGHSTGAIALSTLAIGYAGLLLSFLVSLRLLPQPQWGLVAVVSVIVIVKLSDVGAYFTGRALGRHKMSPVLSPKKTLEGAAGGIAAACLGAWICRNGLVPWLTDSATSRGTAAGWFVYGLILAVAGMCGDLAESLLKRDAQRKDSSSWLPGLGGVLDILDSLLFAAAPAYVCWAIGLVGPWG
jgi:phosphatidate cytidylyltransferase